VGTNEAGGKRYDDREGGSCKDPYGVYWGRGRTGEEADVGKNGWGT